MGHLGGLVCLLFMAQKWVFDHWITAPFANPMNVLVSGFSSVICCFMLFAAGLLGDGSRFKSCFLTYKHNIKIIQNEFYAPDVCERCGKLTSTSSRRLSEGSKYNAHLYWVCAIRVSESSKLVETRTNCSKFIQNEFLHVGCVREVREAEVFLPPLCRWPPAHQWRYIF